MTWAKICGIRDVATARAVAACAPDAVGLNFYPPSPRSVSLDTAIEIARMLPVAIERVALFVNAEPSEIVDVCLKLACDGSLPTVQLHGDETPADMARLRDLRPDLRIIRACRVDEDLGLNELAEQLDQCDQLGLRPVACLLDARVAGSFGGTGHVAPWEMIARQYRRDVWPPLILAGGLTPENVRQAIAIVNPWGVDTAGGVESSRGVKDPHRVAAFLQTVRATRSEAIS